MVLKGFLGPTYKERSTNFAAQRCINLYPLLAESGEPKEPVALVSIPGMTLFASIGIGPIRGIHYLDFNLYVVSGNKLYQVKNDASNTLLGELVSSTGPVDIENNGYQVAVVDGAKLYIYNTLTGVFSIPNPQPVGPPTSICFIDQYFIVSIDQTNKFQLSELNDGTLWDPTDFGTAEADPDNLLTCRQSHRQLYLIGETTTEIWFDAGTSPFPFATTSGVIDYGIGAPHSVVKAYDSLVWLGVNKAGAKHVLLAFGYEVKVISTIALEQEWNTYGVISDAYAFSYEQSGNQFYILTFPTAAKTFVYDLRTQLWHERMSFELGQWRPSCHAYFIDKHVVGDFFNSNLYVLSSTKYTENSNPIQRIRVTPVGWNDRKRLIFHSLQVEFEAGVGDGSGLAPGTNPVAQLRWSDDGGHTWSNYYSAIIGSQGKYGTRSIWRKLGQTDERIFEVSVSDPVKVVLIGCSAEVEGNSS